MSPKCEGHLTPSVKAQKDWKQFISVCMEWTCVLFSFPISVTHHSLLFPNRIFSQLAREQSQPMLIWYSFPTCETCSWRQRDFKCMTFPIIAMASDPPLPAMRRFSHYLFCSSTAISVPLPRLVLSLLCE